MYHRHCEHLVRTAIVLGLCIALTFIGVTLFIVSRFDGSPVLPADCALVFGAAVYTDRPSPAITRRVRTAVDLYHQKKVRRLILSGGKGSRDVLTEAKVMEAIALRDGVSPQNILREERSRSTIENLQFSLPLAKNCESVIAVSDEFHLARIELLGRRTGWGSLPTIPAKIPSSPRSELKSVLREALGYIYYALRIDHIADITRRASLP